MQPLFFVQNNHVQHLTIPVARFAHKHGICLEDRSSYVGFDPEDCGVDWAQFHPVLPYGSLQFLRKLKSAPSLARYVHHDEERFSARTWTEQLPCMLNADGRVVLAKDVPAVLAEAPAHVRPLQEDKAFTAGLFSTSQWQELTALRNLREDLPCWVSSAKDIFAEWRLWLVGGRIVGASRYREAGVLSLEKGAPADVQSLVKAVAATWTPAPCVGVDVARTPFGLKVVEFNPIHCCGWYAVDVDTVLQSWLQWNVQKMHR